VQINPYAFTSLYFVLFNKNKVSVTTIKEIARRLNISVSTVSRALHNHESIGLRTKTRVKELAAELNYEPNQRAIFFQQKKTFTIGVILPELSEAFFATAISGIEDTANSNKYTVLMGQSHDDEEREKRIVTTMKDHQVDGLIVSLAKNTENYDHFKALAKYDIPVVFFDRIPNLEDIHYVACNMESGTVQLVNFLLKKNHRAIALINGPEKLLASQQRKHGYIKAITNNRLKYDPSLIVSSDLTPTGTYDAMEQLLSAKRIPEAVVTFNDYVMLDAVQYAKKKKLKINKDIRFVSYANLPFSSHTAFPPMASLEQYPYQQGQKATELLLQLLNLKKEQRTGNPFYKIIIEPTLIIKK
jgi:LacI family repressor for deo operon, udp, cdd, tsx, nupC, and nupG